MRRLNGRELKALFVLSIAVPVGVLVSLRLTSVLQEPIIISETITLETIEWKFQRPNQYVVIMDKLNVTYTVDDFSANMHVLVVDFANNSQFSDDNDFLRMIMFINSTIPNQDGFVESVYVVFNKDQSSKIDWIGTEFYFENLSLAERIDGYKSNMEAYVKLNGMNHPDRIYFRATAEWSLLTPKNQPHQLELLYELTYFNGTVYKKVVQPFQLRIFGG